MTMLGIRDDAYFKSWTSPPGPGGRRRGRTGRTRTSRFKKQGGCIRVEKDGVDCSAGVAHRRARAGAGPQDCWLDPITGIPLSSSAKSCMAISRPVVFRVAVTIRDSITSRAFVFRFGLAMGGNSLPEWGKSARGGNSAHEPGEDILQGQAGEGLNHRLT